MTATTDDDLRRHLLETAEREGVAVVQVAESEGEPPFAFSVGTWRRCAAAEAVVVGVAPEVAHALLMTYAQRVAAGERFEPGRLYDGFLEGHKVTFERVAEQFYPEYFGHAFLVYRNGQFPAVQILVPVPGSPGVFPWHEEAPAGFDRWQPVLTDSGRPESWRPGADGP
ncbi:hypothetical protein GCM10012275_48510 [Longimycelium tulufanense]|uniref:DUF4262 domain-containing protein n=1 Tax=Longimycelium tulufanense TaxID=907463 RepID=A0A8J3CIL6_9PSEU|nr:DUF4262 domain-containing protein [Longimycelium tulufanense]GGM72266.1 hypothetical protein GCM10012275_48510 [Longimycelium tulufanense]